MAAISEHSLLELRRDLHRYPEVGWKEFRTTSLVAEELEELGYVVHLGNDALDENERLGVPDNDEIRRARDRAIEEGAPKQYIDRIGSITGLVAEKTFGTGSGPTIGIRVDMDALEIAESSKTGHRPADEGFASCHPNEMHACGHDGHTAIGVGIARELVVTDDFVGTIKLFFQPAEEGGRGGLPMSTTSHLTDVDYFLALHLGLGNETGTIIAGYDRPLSNAKIDVEFRGESAHAGKAPNEGNNALLAMTTAIQNLYAIPRHGSGVTRINVGHVDSPNAENVISDRARMRVEVRGEATDVNEYMLDSAERVIAHAAGMYGVSYDSELYGKTVSFDADEHLVMTTADAARSTDSVSEVLERERFGASEDASYLIKRVQAEGGQATFVGVGASTPSGHHTSRFDIDEDALEIGVDVIVNTIRRLDGAERSEGE